MQQQLSLNMYNYCSNSPQAHLLNLSNRLSRKEENQESIFSRIYLLTLFKDAKEYS